MYRTPIKLLKKQSRQVWIGIGLGVLLWALNSFIRRIFFHNALPSRNMEVTTDALLGLLFFIGAGVYFRLKLHQRTILEEQLRKLSRAVEQSPSTVVITDLKGSIEYVNPKFTQLTGYTPDEVRGRNPRFLKSGETSPEEYRQLWTAITAGEEWRGEFHNKKKNGELYWEAASISPIKNANGVITHFVAVKEDITARKEAESAEREQRTLAQALSDTVAILNGRLDLQEVLEAILTHAGRVVPHDAAHILLIEEGIARVAGSRGYAERGLEAAVMAVRFPVTGARAINRLVETQQPFTVSDAEPHAHWADLAVMQWARSYAAAPIRLNGGVIGILGLDSQQPNAFTPLHASRLQAFADQAGIAIQNARLYDAVRDYALEMEQRVLERTAELDRERAKLRAILDGMAEGVAYIEHGRIVYTNGALARLVGFEMGDLLHRPPGDIYQMLAGAEGDFSLLEASIRAAFKRGDVWREHMPLRHRDGRPLDVMVSLSQVYGRAEEPIGWVAIARDISREKALQAQRDRFLTHAAHELRTPVSNIKTRLYLARRQPEKLDYHLGVMEQVTEEMRVLIEDLLDVFRLQRGMAQLDRQNFVLQEVIDRVLNTQQPEAERKGVLLACDTVETPLWVCADLRRLTQVIANLVTNAIQATPSGATVTVRLLPSSNGDQGYALLGIHDSGAGIDASLLDQVFDPFFHATEGDDNHLGLALTLAREIVELHDGAISLESEAGRGSVFTVQLPLAEDCAGTPSGSGQQEVVYANR